ncbi:MAG: hypothetical protein N2042_01425, partial [Thermodesulfovibrio sp.]|nr:hypothetical protein [Thermodesulfovibrio sp.]
MISSIEESSAKAKLMGKIRKRNKIKSSILIPPSRLFRKPKAFWLDRSSGLGLSTYLPAFPETLSPVAFSIGFNPMEWAFVPY